jgi:hypothetical protein
LSKRKSKKKRGKKSKPHESIAVKPPEEAGREYAKELGTINKILQSVATPNYTNGQNQEPTGGFIRPFSTEELGQLLKSIVGNVANIHQQIPVVGSVNSILAAEKGKRVKVRSCLVNNQPVIHLSQPYQNRRVQRGPKGFSFARIAKKSVKGDFEI